MSRRASKILLDTGAVADFARQLPCLEANLLAEIKVSTLWVKPGRHFNVLYEIGAKDDGPLLLSGFSLDSTRADRIMSRFGRHRCEEADSLQCGPCATLRADSEIVLQLFPLDYRLPTLPECLCSESVQRALGANAEIVESKLSGYRPGMRCQIRYRFADGAVGFGKVALEREPGRAFQLQEKIHAKLGSRSGSVRAAEPWRYLSDLRLTLLHAASGEHLDDVLRSEHDQERTLRRVATALGEFHSSRIEGIDRVYQPADEIVLLGGWVRLISELFPALAPILQASYQHVRATQPPPAARPSLVHRDFYEKQILLAPDGLTFLDLDTVCWGDPEIDLGNFCAHLRLRGLQSGSPAWSRLAEAAFLASYPMPFAPQRITWYRLSALLRLACVYALRPAWGWLAPALATEARGARKERASTRDRLSPRGGDDVDGMR